MFLDNKKKIIYVAFDLSSKSPLPEYLEPKEFDHELIGELTLYIKDNPASIFPDSLIYTALKAPEGGSLDREFWISGLNGKDSTFSIFELRSVISRPSRII